MYVSLMCLAISVHLQRDGPSAGQKRHTPITYSSDSPANKHPKTDKSQREIYQPPSGKYSNKVSSYGKFFLACVVYWMCTICMVNIKCKGVVSWSWHNYWTAGWMTGKWVFCLLQAVVYHFSTMHRQVLESTRLPLIGNEGLFFSPH